MDAGLLIYEITNPYVSQRRAFDDLDSKFNGFLLRLLMCDTCDTVTKSKHFARVLVKQAKTLSSTGTPTPLFTLKNISAQNGWYNSIPCYWQKHVVVNLTKIMVQNGWMGEIGGG